MGATTGAAVGRVSSDLGLAEDRYVEHLVASLHASVPEPLAGLRIAVDCANGAASDVGPAALRAAGAEVVVINASPDGRNINEKCGSTHPEQLQATVVAAGADLGVAFDGDADRCLAVDGTGALVDGDQIMGILAMAMKGRGELEAHTLVTTVMSNLGLELAMADAGIVTVQTAVGDRYVLEAMRAGGYVLGGEQSGHVIMSRHATTGDGTLTALHLAATVCAPRADPRGARRAGAATSPGAGQRRRRGPQPGGRRRGAGGDRGRRGRAGAHRQGAAAPVRAPNLWCGSWSRPPPRSRPSASPNSWRVWCATG